MAFEDAADRAVQDFEAFTRSYDTSVHPDGYTHLQDYLITWLDEGHAIENTGGNFETYLRTALHIADAVFKNPAILDYSGQHKIAHPDAYSRNPETGDYERPVSGVIDRERESYLAFDRHEYEVIRFRLENRGKGFLMSETDSTRLPMGDVPPPVPPLADG